MYKISEKVNYVDNKKLFEVMKDYYEKNQRFLETGLDQPAIPEYVGECLLLIANKLASSSNYRRYTYLDEMISDGIENVIRYAITNFDPNKTKNPFSYFTTIINYAFIRRIETEKKQQYFKHKNYQKTMMFQELSGELMDARVSINDDPSFDIIASFEKRMKEKNKNNKKEGIEKFLDTEDSDE